MWSAVVLTVLTAGCGAEILLSLAGGQPGFTPGCGMAQEPALGKGDPQAICQSGTWFLRCILSYVAEIWQPRPLRTARHVLWVTDAYSLASWEEHHCCWVLYWLQSSLEKVSSFPFKSVLQSICCVSCEWFLWKGAIPMQDLDTPAAERALRGRLNPQLCSSWYQRAFIFNKS